MLHLELARDPSASPSILCLGAHADDVEIGCGGTILRLLREWPNARMRWIVFSACGERAEEARASASAFLAGAGTSDVVLHSTRDGFFPAAYASLKEIFEALKRTFVPDLIFTHYRNDLHQDHSLVSELTHNTFRDHVILEYEIPKYDPDIGNPNVFVDLHPDCADQKVTALMRHFASQRSRPWFTPDLFYGLMRLRGMQSAAATHLAEGFYATKLRLDFAGASRSAQS